MKGNDTSVNQITEGVIWKQLLLFFFPILLGTFFQQLYNTADTVVVGRFVGKEALASVGGSTAQIANLVVGFFVGLASGATVVISQFYGARDREQVNRSLRTAYAFSIVGGILITIVGILTASWLLELMNTPQQLMKDSLIYLQIYFGGILFVFVYNTGSSILRAVGDSKTPLYVLIVCCLLNIVLDLLLVVGFHMGVAGAAIATIFSQAVSAVLVTAALMRSDDIYQLQLREIRFFKQALISLIWIGLPAGIQSTMYSISNMVIQTSLNSLGTDTVAAWTAFGKIDSMYWMVNNSLGIAVTTFVGQNFGAGKYDRMKRSVRVGIGMGLVAAVAISGGKSDFPPVHHRRRGNLHRHGYPPPDGPRLLPVRVHRTAVRSPPGNRRRDDPHAAHLRRRLRTAGGMDSGGGSPVSRPSDHHLQLPGDLADHGRAVYHLLPDTGETFRGSAKILEPWARPVRDFSHAGCTRRLYGTSAMRNHSSAARECGRAEFRHHKDTSEGNRNVTILPEG